MTDKTLRVMGVAAIGAVLMLLLCAAIPNPAESAAPRVITVTGEAEVRVVPDEVVLTLGVETNNKDLKAAKDANDRIVAKVLALAAQYGIQPQHVQTDYVGIEPRYRDGYYEERDFIGFFVHKTVVVTLRDLSKFEGLLSDVLSSGVNYVQGIQFRTTELRKNRDQARALAIQAAQEKAVALAGQLGQKIGDPLTIQEERNDWWSGYNAWWGGRWGGAMSQNVIQEADGSAGMTEGSLAPGQIAVKARVSVSFELTK